MASTCPAGPSDGCAFLRTVSAVPEPAAATLLALGLAALGGWRARRRRA